MNIWPQLQFSFRQFKRWLQDGKHLWIWLLIFGIVFSVCYLFPQAVLPHQTTLSDRLRWLGMFLQFFGVTNVILGLSGSKRLFGATGFLRSAASWIGRFGEIFVRLQARSASANIVMDPITIRATANSPQINPTMESRISDLEKKVGKLEANLDSRFREAKEHARVLTDSERDARISEDRRISEKLESAVVGSFALQVSGAFFLFAGILLTSIPDETASFLGKLGL